MINLPNIKCLSCEWYKGIAEDNKEMSYVVVNCCERNGIEKDRVIICRFNCECLRFLPKGKRMNVLKGKNVNYRGVY